MGKLQVAQKQYVRVPNKTRFYVGEQYDPIEALGLLPKEGVLNFGVELEMGFKPGRQEYMSQDSKYFTYSQDNSMPKAGIIELYDRVEGYCVLKHDCGAIEIVSVPLDYNDIRAYLETLLDGPIPGQRNPQPEDWGMHVHVSALQTPAHLKRMLKFLLNKEGNSNRFMDFIAGRPTDGAWLAGDMESDYNDEDDDFSNGWGNLPEYLEFRRNTRNRGYGRHADVPRDAWLSEQSPRHGIAINTPHGTHEFRLFATTNDPVRACSNVEFVQALIDYADPASLPSLPVDQLKQVENFCKFVYGAPNRYPNLITRMDKTPFKVK